VSGLNRALANRRRGELEASGRKILKGLNHSARRWLVTSDYAGQQSNMAKALKGLKQFTPTGIQPFQGLNLFGY